MTAHNISEITVLDLKSEAGRLVALSDTDHLLRRFGQAEVRTLAAGQQTAEALRPVADQVWAILTGEVELRLEDRRAGSPSEGQVDVLSLTAAKPQAVLIPFGVAYTFTAASDAQLLGLSTHADE